MASRSIAVGVAGIAALIANACGSDSSSAEAKGCEPQSTRECVGPAACKGGQVCGADHKWSACDCGGGTGGGGSGGTGGSGGSGGTAGGGGGTAGAGGSSAGGGTAGSGGTTGGTGGTISTGGTGGSTDAGDASTDQVTGDVGSDVVESGVGPNDDPCPTDPINVNCSSSCGSKSQCGICSYSNPGVPITEPAASHFVIRTPSPPFVGTSCTSCDGGAGPPPVYRMEILYKGVSGYFRIKVGKPWKVWGANDWNGWSGSCIGSQFAKGCEYAGTGSGTANLAFYIATDDPNAPARNVLIEKFTGPSCTAADYWQ